MEGLKRKIARKITQYLVRNLLVALTEDDILTLTNKGWYLRGRKLSPEDIGQLKDEASMLKKSVLWELMSHDIRFLANDRMFEKSATEGNSVFGRAMLYNLNLMGQFLDRITKL